MALLPAAAAKGGPLRQAVQQGQRRQSLACPLRHQQAVNNWKALALAACSAAVLTGEQNRSDTPHRWGLQARHLTLLWWSSDEYRHVKLFNFHTRKVNEFIFALNLLWSLRFLSYILILLRNSKSCILYSILSTVIQYLRTLLISFLRTVDR